MSILKYRAYDGKSVRYDVTGFEHFNANEMGSVFIDGDCYKIVKSMDDKNYSQFPSAIVDQYTGLKDKNNVEIYCGDIVECRMQIDGGSLPHAGEIIYMNSFGAFATRNLAGETLLHNHLLNTFLVVGNIHENPELLQP